ncbi:unnamed protein product [Effrenium voratum]|nr:unnamed protein product [Effrenium voratum]
MIKMLFASLPGFKSFKLDDLVAALDVNKDGMISREEFLSGLFEAKGGRSPRSVSLNKLLEYSPSGCSVARFTTPDIVGYDKRCLPDEGSWLQLRASLQEKQAAFQDESFGPNDGSLYGGTEADLSDKAAAGQKATFKVELWQRIWEMDHAKQGGPLVKNGASAHDIEQGQLGDCYFVSALAALAESPAFMARLLPGAQTINPEGIYAVRFWQDGEWRVVVVDDQLPCRKPNRLFFAAARNGDFWVSLVEKAYAKLCGSYYAIKSGSQPDAFLALTGLTMPQTIKLRSYRPDPEDKKELYRLMRECASTGGLLGCASKGKWEKGIAPLHAYTVLGLREVETVDGEMLKMVHIRNPWGAGIEWKGKFSDGDSAWDSVHEAVREDMNAKKAKDGTWWMTLDDFCEHFFCAYFGWHYGETCSLYQVATEQGESGLRPSITVQIRTAGPVRAYIQGPTKRAVPKQAQGQLPVLEVTSKHSKEGKGAQKTKCRTRSKADMVFHAGPGDSVDLNIRLESPGRVYVTLVCPPDSAVLANHGNEMVFLSSYRPSLPEPAEPQPNPRSLRSLRSRKRSRRISRR